MLTDKEITVNTASWSSTDPSRLLPVCDKDENKAAVAYVKDSGEIAICTTKIPVVGGRLAGPDNYILPRKKADIDEWCSPVKGSKPTACKYYVAFFTFTDPTDKLFSIEHTLNSGQYGWYDHYSIISFTIKSYQSGNYVSASECHGYGDFETGQEVLDTGVGPLEVCRAFKDLRPHWTAILDNWQNPKNLSIKFLNGKTGTVHVMEIHP